MSPSYRRLLVIRYGALGDILLTTPLLSALRAQLPDCEIDAVVRPCYRELLSANPAVTRVIALPGDSELYKLRGPIRAAGYDCVLDLQNKIKSRILSRFSRAPQIVRLRRRTLGETISERFGGPKPAEHGEALRYLQVLGQLGLRLPPRETVRLHFSPSPHALQHAARLLADRRPIGIVPCASQATKRWPAERFSELATLLEAAGLCDQVLLAGPPDEAYLAAHDACFPSTIERLPSSLSIDEVAAVLARCRVVVGVDTGLLHLAAAVGTPVVALFGPTDCVRWGPTGVPSRIARVEIDCAPCRSHGGASCPRQHHRCMRELRPADVAETLRDLLQAIGGTTGDPVAP